MSDDTDQELVIFREIDRGIQTSVGKCGNRIRVHCDITAQKLTKTMNYSLEHIQCFVYA